MKIANRSSRAGEHDCSSPMILSQRATQRGDDASLVVQQVSLALSDDKERITLRRYFEHYDPACGEWVEYIHSVPTRELVHWLMAQGKLLIESSQGGRYPQAQP
ncbi:MULTISPECIES: hypothetical protein [unclassified Pseudomonas]|uniref:hypothetical protein n=1 Tax=unclassified Pseudomonas TaxID=196821 RepID=UPI002447164A|nr:MULTISPECIES: hypothetical protein [unclassified Pseudomonas]MDH0300896.1 hypothetical protein [Pseudomonas sp. GD04091]MDH1985195.1 hypothetical protein [Pseudomonas sp. GD03689]